MFNFRNLLKNQTRLSGPSWADDPMDEPMDEFIEEKIQPKNEKKKTKRKEKVKNYSHGDSVLIIKNNDSHKGYFGNVVDFYPATYELETTGTNYVKAEDIETQDISKKVNTKFGQAEVLERINRVENKSSVFEFIVYNDNNVQKLGLLVDDNKKIISYLESQGNNINDVYSILDNKNNNFVREIKQDEITMDVMKLNVNEIDEITNNIESLDIADRSKNLIESLSKLINNLDSNSMVEIKDGYPQYLTPQDYIFEQKISVVFNKDIVGQKYYMIYSGTNKGWTNVYKPDYDYFKVKYELVVKYKPNQINIIDKVNRQDENELRYATVKKGDYIGNKFLIVKYNQAKILVRLISDNNQIVYEPSDVFYFDIKLVNGNVAQVLDTLSNNELRIKEKNEDNNQFVINIISENEISEKLSGFSLDKEIKESTQKPVENYKFPNNNKDIDEPIQEIYDDNDDDNKSISGYDDENLDSEEILEPESNDIEFKESFKDTERTSKNVEDLNKLQMATLNKIISATKSFSYNLDEYVILKRVENIIGCIKNTLKITNVSKYDERFIIVLVIAYETIENNFDFDLTDIINKLYTRKSKKFFTEKDIEDKDDLLFIDQDKLNSNKINKMYEIEINNSITNEKPSTKRNVDIIEKLILHIDIIIKSECNNSNVDLTIKYKNNPDSMIPVGFNIITQKRFKDELEEKSRVERVTSKVHYTFENFLNDAVLPLKEINIMWDNDSKLVINRFIIGLSQKENEQPGSTKLISYIKNNLYRGPFALNDTISKTTKKEFSSILMYLKNSIIQFKQNKSDKLNEIRNETKKENDNINNKRKRIVNNNELVDKRKIYNKLYSSSFNNYIDTDDKSKEEITKKEEDKKMMNRGKWTRVYE